MTDIAKLERLLRMQLRALTEKSYAREQRFYRDPAESVRFEREKNESRGSGMTQAQKIAVVDTFHKQTPYDTCMSIWTEWMKLNDQQHSTGFANPQDVKEFMATAEAVNTMIDDLPRYQWWAIRKSRGICTVWNFPNVSLEDALQKAEDTLTPKLQKNLATRRYFL